MPLDIVLAQLSSIPVVSFDCDSTLPTLLDVPFVLSAPRHHSPKSACWRAICSSVAECDSRFRFAIKLFKDVLAETASLCAAGPRSIKTQWSHVLDGTWEMF